MQDDQVERTAEKLDKLRIHVNSGKESGTQGERPKEVKSIATCILISTHKNIFMKSNASVQLYSSK